MKKILVLFLILSLLMGLGRAMDYIRPARVYERELEVKYSLADVHCENVQDFGRSVFVDCNVDEYHHNSEELHSHYFDKEE